MEPNDTAIQQKIYEIAKRYNKNPLRLTQSEYQRFSLMARESLVEKISAVASAGSSLLKTKFLNLRISEEKANQNKSICESCPDNKYKVLADGNVACEACGCSGKYLRSKWEDKSQKCPNGHWDNTVDNTLENK